MNLDVKLTLVSAEANHRQEFYDIEKLRWD